MKQNILILFSVTALVSLSSCFLKSSGNNTGIEYAPDMYYSKGYEAYSQFEDSSKYRYNPYFMSMREPAAGTVAEGQLDYKYNFDNTNEGYEASNALTMPFLTLKEQKEGERLYGIYCAVCHGEKGGNDGSVSSKQATLKPSWANYKTKFAEANYSIGKAYHVITYGKNNMGSYASALNPKERWMVLSYVKRLSMADTTGNIPEAVEAKYESAAENSMGLPTGNTQVMNGNIKTIEVLKDDKDELAKLMANPKKETKNIKGKGSKK